MQTLLITEFALLSLTNQIQLFPSMPTPEFKDFILLL